LGHGLGSCLVYLQVQNVLLLTTADFTQTLLKQPLLFSQSYHLPLGFLALLAEFVLLFKDSFGFVLTGGQFADTVVSEALFAALLGRRQNIGHAKGSTGGAGPHGQDTSGEKEVSPLVTTHSTRY
jgi:hypothetical protein